MSFVIVVGSRFGGVCVAVVVACASLISPSLFSLCSLAFPCLPFFIYFHAPTPGKGGKNRRRGKNDNEETKRELEYKEEGQEYAQVVRMLGNGRCECFCFDGVTRLGHIRGKMR